MNLARNSCEGTSNFILNFSRWCTSFLRIPFHWDAKKMHLLESNYGLMQRKWRKNTDVKAIKPMAFWIGEPSVKWFFEETIFWRDLSVSENSLAHHNYIRTRTSGQVKLFFNLEKTHESNKFAFLYSLEVGYSFTISSFFFPQNLKPEVFLLYCP